MKTHHKVVIGDCTNMREIGDNSIQLMGNNITVSQLNSREMMLIEKLKQESIKNNFRIIINNELV